MNKLFLSLLIIFGVNFTHAQFSDRPAPMPTYSAPDNSAQMPTPWIKSCAPEVDSYDNSDWYSKSRCAKLDITNPGHLLDCKPTCKPGYQPAGNQCCQTKVHKRKPDKNKLHPGDKTIPLFSYHNCTKDKKGNDYPCENGKKRFRPMHSKSKSNITYCCNYRENPLPEHIYTESELNLLCSQKQNSPQRQYRSPKTQY